MGYIVSLIVAVAFVGPLARTLKHRSGACYAAAALVAAAAFAVQAVGGLPGISGLLSGVANGFLAFCLFTVVMFTGTFRPGSAARIRLMQIRQPLALVACVCAIGHIACVLGAVAAYGSGRASVLFIALCLALAVLLAVVGATSPTFVSDRMPQRVWQGIHCLAYPFFIIVCIHAALAAWPHSTALAVFYGIVGVAYAGLRLRRAKKGVYR